MISRPGGLDGLLVFEPRVFRDDRGYFVELHQAARYRDFGLEATFVQDNLSHSRRGVVRGLHYQWQHPQGKLVSVVRGAIWDVAVDLRRASPTFGHWWAIRLDDRTHTQFWLPAGFAHGFQALEDDTLVLYKVTDFWQPGDERTLAWDDPQLAITWPLADAIVSAKDRQGQRFSEATAF
jgi:dTDP-4-dehydrorhamnose 3,5-epimerase